MAESVSRSDEGVKVKKASPQNSLTPNPSPKGEGSNYRRGKIG